MLNRDQILAILRHIVQAVSSALALLVALHMINPDQASQATDALNQISPAIATLIGAVATLVSVGMAAWSAISASPLWQIFAVKKIADNPSSTLSKNAQIAVVNAAASVPGTEKVVNPILSPNPSTVAKVTKE